MDMDRKDDGATSSNVQNTGSLSMNQAEGWF